MTRIALTIGLFATVTGGLFAQSYQLVANVPFDFRVGQKVLKAGVYTFEKNVGSLVVKGPGKDNSATWLIQSTERLSEPRFAEVVFNRYGQMYFLSEVWTPGSHIGSAIIRSSYEKEIAQRRDTFDRTAVVARRP